MKMNEEANHKESETRYGKTFRSRMWKTQPCRFHDLRWHCWNLWHGREETKRADASMKEIAKQPEVVLDDQHLLKQ
ncbi:unnamed protein product [Lathyrus sativus]|nr:unnamed protein product [Lathyrus sativus]